jgi:hypothetical protein
MRDEYGSVEWAGKFSTKFSGLHETIPDTQDYILWNKIGKSIGVYSGVYEYTQQIQEQIQSIQSIRGIWGFAVSCRQDSCSVIVALVE